PSPPAAPPPAPKPRRRGRWTDRLTGMLLLLGGGVVVVTASPALLRAGGLLPSRIDGAPHDAGRLQRPHPPAAAPRATPGPDDEDEGEPLITGLEREYPDGMWPGRRSAEDRARERAIFGESEAHGGRRGVTRRPIKLREDPGGEGSVQAMIR